MEVIDSGMVTLVNPMQLENAELPMEVTELGIVTLVRPLQPSNALLPMEATELGMVVLLQPAINVLLAVSMMALQLLRESNVEFPLSTTILVRSVHP